VSQDGLELSWLGKSRPKYSASPQKMLSACFWSKLPCFLFVRTESSGFPLAGWISKLNVELLDHWPILCCFWLLRYQQQATQLFSLGNYPPHVIIYGCKKRWINISYQCTFCMSCKEFLLFSYKIWEASEKFKNLPRLSFRYGSVYFGQF